jgi:hypothetical protein
MSLVLTTPTNPGKAEWQDAALLPPPSLPYEVVQLNSGTYLIPSGTSRLILFAINAPGLIIRLPSAAANPGVTLILTALSSGSATIGTVAGDSIGPYGLPLSLDATGSPRSLTFVSVPVAADVGQNYWMLVASE